MINSNVTRATHELLQEHGIVQHQGEDLPDYFARGLGVSREEAEAFLKALAEGMTVEQAQAATGVRGDPSLLVRLAEAIGTALAKMRG